ncbi:MULTISPECIES: substrate-binding domain-containing protein [unclassified Bradyrhizobium]|uniref:substrate-binding domain-containing protein n=1 Tax=unclassified Bradyrhizobium TaxID=2631580 RepID=UPI002478EF6A|nr:MULTISPECIES: substrate-binding domain-containing protein [unclassified Bradyrhizobium]WGS18650.1 substrate-binding domain-containing protein [Bradyrhizobium sp. ISRA463]WGS25473.1 substrate-binding domain-containing protein [Bradyrhizobium sp. ISRA464]
MRCVLDWGHQNGTVRPCSSPASDRSWFGAPKRSTPCPRNLAGNKVNISYDEAGIVRKRILRGEDFDVTFLPAGWEEIRKTLADDPVAVAHSDLGMAVLSTVPKPDTSTNEATKRTLLAVKSIVYTDPKTGGIAGVLFARMIERLGIADEINKKSKLVAGQLNATFVAKGEAELAIQLSSEIHEVSGVQFVPMPPEFRARVTFSGAVAAGANEPGTAKAFLEFLTAPGGA